MTIQNENSKNLCEKLVVLTLSNWKVPLKLCRVLPRNFTQYWARSSLKVCRIMLRFILDINFEENLKKLMPVYDQPETSLSISARKFPP